MTTDQLRELEKRLSEATSGNYALECEIQRLLEPDRQAHHLVAPKYTLSLDAAIALCERLGLTPSLEKNDPRLKMVAWDAWAQGDKGNFHAAKDAPALALCLAAIRAIAGKAAE